MGGKGSGRRPAPRQRTAQDVLTDRVLVKPPHLDGDASVFWDRVVKLLPYLVAADGPWLEIASRAWATLQKDIEMIRSDPEDASLRRRWTESMKVWMDAAKALGLNPKDRRQINGKDIAQDADPFEGFLQIA